MESQAFSVRRRTQKILGSLADEAVTPHLVVLSAHTTRVPVIHGHTLMASIKMDDRPSVDQVAVLNAELMMVEGWVELD